MLAEQYQCFGQKEPFCHKCQEVYTLALQPLFTVGGNMAQAGDRPLGCSIMDINFTLESRENDENSVIALEYLIQ